MPRIITGYNPDVLSCLANLSNDEVFTPPEVANAMLDMLPEELFMSTETKFLDPACKSGVFLREIAKRLLSYQVPDYERITDELNYKRRMKTPFTAEEEAWLSALRERVDHIMHNQLYGIAITELTSLLSRRSLYCSKYPNSKYSISSFDDVSGNIRYKNIKHSFRDGRCVFCGASQKEYDRGDLLESHAYELIHTTKPQEIFNMKFDVIIGNPPYQLSTGGNRAQATPLYDRFVEQSKKLNPRYLCMIIPSRWFAGGMGLSEFRTSMIKDSRLRKLVDYPNSKDCFEGVDIAGGVCYFLWDRDNVGTCEITSILGKDSSTMTRKLDEFGDLIIRSNTAIPIIHKVKNKSKAFLSDKVLSLDPFGFPTTEKGKEKTFTGAIKLIHSKGIGYIDRRSVSKNIDLIDKYKVYIARVVPSNGEVGIDPSKGYNAITQPRILKPGEVCNFTYMILNSFDSEREAKNFQKYVSLKFVRYMLRLTYSSMNISKGNFIFVPDMDYTKEWTDFELYDYFGLSQAEIDGIESLIRPMEQD